MKQIFQNLKNGEIFFLEVPYPNLEKNKIIIKTNESLISSGTERYLLDFGKSSYFQKAKSEPERVKQVISKIRTDGVISTFKAVNSKLDRPFPMGYCNVGIVDKTSCLEFKEGDRVVSNSNHSEIVINDPNFTCKIPNNVSDNDACFAVPASICLNGIRSLQLSFGESVVVYGLGLLGLISIQILKNSGFVVYGVDKNQERIEKAKSLGVTCFNSADNKVENYIISKNKSLLDGALITAASNDENLLNDTTTVLRNKGKIICIGSVPINFDRNLIYKKEISFGLSASYGPERYNPEYINSKTDYPKSIERWSVKRNLEYALDLISNKKIILDNLISKKFNFENAKDAYSYLTDKNPIALSLKYSSEINLKDEVTNLKPVSRTKFVKGLNFVGIVGAGNYSTRFILPEISKNKKFKVKVLSSSKGVSSSFFSKKFEVEKSTTNNLNVFEDKNINCVFISTPHNLHSEQALSALKNKKKVFLEKPIAVNNQQLDEFKNSYNDLVSKNFQPFLMLGYNRRYSTLIKRVKDNLEFMKQPCSINYNINAGQIDKQSWLHDLDIGGGRIIGEVCHFIDLIKYLTNSRISTYSFQSIDMKEHVSDNISINFKFSNNSIANINYFSNGNKNFPKETINIFCNGVVMQIDNFKKLKIYGSTKYSGKSLFAQDKGNSNCIKDFLFRVEKDDEQPISFENLYDTNRITNDITSKIFS